MADSRVDRIEVGPTQMDMAAKLDADYDEFLSNVMEKNKGYKYTEGLTGENIDEEMEKIPMFMTRIPTQEEIDASPALSAIQALKYECDDPYESAVSHKEDGNYHFKCKLYKKAIAAYGEGIKVQCNDAELNAVLFSNRAAAHYYLGNLRSALLDVTQAVKHKPNHMKAFVRGAQCSFELRKFKECLQWCDSGLQADPKDKKLLDLRKKASTEWKKQERDRRKKEHEEVQKAAKRRALANAIKKRGVKTEGFKLMESEGVSSDDEAEDEISLPSSSDRTHGHHVYLDEHDALHWPVFILQPEFSQSDFIADFNENQSFEDHFKVMFLETPPPWDIEKKYHLDNILLYFEHGEGESLVHVELHHTLKEVLSDPRYVVKGETPSFVVLSSISDFTSEIFSNTCVEDF